MGKWKVPCTLRHLYHVCMKDMISVFFFRTWSHRLLPNQLLSGFLAKHHLPRVSCQSRLSANDKGDNEMISWAVHRSPGICWTNTSARRSSMKAVQPVIVSDGVPYLQMRSVGSHSTPGMEMEGKDGVGGNSKAFPCQQYTIYFS